MAATGMGTGELDNANNGDLLLLLVDGIVPRTIAIDPFPFTVGRKTDRDLVISDLRVSREDAKPDSDVDMLNLFLKAARKLSLRRSG